MCGLKGPHQDGHEHQDVRPARDIERVELSRTDRLCVVNDGECDLLTTPVGGDDTCTEPRNITNSGGGGRNYGGESECESGDNSTGESSLKGLDNLESNPIIITC